MAVVVVVVLVREAVEDVPMVVVVAEVPVEEVLVGMVVAVAEVPVEEVLVGMFVAVAEVAVEEDYTQLHAKLQLKKVTAGLFTVLNIGWYRVGPC